MEMVRLMKKIIILLFMFITFNITCIDAVEIGKSMVEVGDGFIVALTADGNVYAWGSNYSGQLGDGTTTNRNLPVRVKGGESGETYLSGVKKISVGRMHAAALMDDGTVYHWGEMGNIAIGGGVSTPQKTPKKVPGGETGSTFLSNIKDISAGGAYTLGLTTEGVVYAWGNNELGQLGRGFKSYSENPRKVAAGEAGGTYLTGVVKIDAGSGHAVVMKSDKTPYIWGQNSYQQLANWDTTEKLTPIKVWNVPGIIDIQAGGGHTVMHREDVELFAKGVYSLGWNTYGQLGIGNNSDMKNWSYTYSGNVKQISAGELTTAILTEDGSVYTCGYNQWGTIGDGTFENRNNETRVKGGEAGGAYLTGVEQVSAGFNTMAALKSDGYIYTWGYNGYGELGNGLEPGSRSTTPVKVKAGEAAGTYLRLFNPNSAPTAPTITSPGAGAYSKNNQVTVNWNFNDPDSGDTQSKYRVQGSTNNFSSVQYDSGVITNAAKTRTTTALANGNWKIRVMTWDSKGVASPWSAQRSFMVDTVAPSFVSATPIGYTYKTGNDIWIKPNVTMKVKTKMSDNLTGLWQSYIAIENADVNRAYLNLDTGVFNEYAQSTLTDILGGVKINSEETEFTIKGLSDMPLSRVLIPSRDRANNDLQPWANTGYKLGVDGTSPNFVSATPTKYTYKRGNDYWIKPNDLFKVKMRGNDDGSSIKYANLRMAYTDDNRATYNFQSNTYNEFNTSVNTDIALPVITYNASGEKELEWTVKGLKDVAPGVVQYYFKDYVENDTSGYQNTVYRLGVDGTSPNFVSATPTTYTYKNGNDYWIKPNDLFKVKIRANDDGSGIWTSNIRLAYSDENRGWYSYRTTDNAENDTSIYTDITGIRSTYNANGEGEVEWTVKGLSDVPLGNIQYYFKDCVENDTNGYQNTAYRLGVDGTAPNDFTSTVTHNGTSGFTINVGAVSDSGSGLPSACYSYYNGASWGAYESSNNKFISGLTPNKSYQLNVRVKDNLGNIKTGVPVNIYTLAEVPSINVESNPGTDYTNINTSRIKITINGGSNPAGTEYRIERATNDTFNENLTIVREWNSSLSYEGEAPDKHTTYYYRVNARNGDQVETTYCDYKYIPGVPNITGTNGGLSWDTAGRGYVKLTWQAVKGATEYEVMIYDGADYRTFNVGTNLVFDTRLEKIYPTETVINSYSDNTRSVDIFKHDKTGLDLRDNPNKLYKTSTGTFYNNISNYAIRVIAKNEYTQSYLISNLYSVALPDRTDVDAPTINVTGNPTSFVNSDVTLNVTTTETESGLSTVLWQEGNKTAASFAGGTVGSALSGGNINVTSNKYITVYAVDNVGNERVSVVNVNKIDKVLPVIKTSSENVKIAPNAYIHEKIRVEDTNAISNIKVRLLHLGVDTGLVNINIASGAREVDTGKILISSTVNPNLVVGKTVVMRIEATDEGGNTSVKDLNIEISNSY
jgi:alpha-tubulin suppressor-like RCC1 family protein